MRYQIYKNGEGKFRIRDEETREWWYTSKWATLPYIGSYPVVDKIDFSFEEAQEKAIALNKKHNWVLVKEQENG